MSSHSCPARRSRRCGIVTARTVTLAAFLVAAIASPHASAQGGHGNGGGGGGGTTGGTIYYNGDASRKQAWTMDANGGSQVQLGFATYGPISTAIHNGHHWFIDVRLIPDEYYPNGTPRQEVFALRDDYDYYTNHNPATRVQLTDDPALQSQTSTMFSMQWIPGDEAISFLARRWVGSEIVEGGLYTAPVLYDPAGTIIGLAQQPGAPTIAFPLNEHFNVDVNSFGWNPSGQQVAYEDRIGLYVADVLGGPHTLIVGGFTESPQWSPDGAKIAFRNANDGISLVKPDGTGLKEIVRRRTDWVFRRPYWSPNGADIVFLGLAINGPYNMDVFRATSAGRSLTNLTNSTSADEMPWGWR